MVVGRLILLVLHIAAAALVFGVPLGLVRSMRSALSSKTEGALAVVMQDAARRSKVAQVASIITLVTGVLLILLSGGFAAVPSSFHVALALMLGAIAFGVLRIKPLMRALSRLSEQAPLDKQRALELIAQVGMGSGLLQALWLLILVLMLYRF